MSETNLAGHADTETFLSRSNCNWTHELALDVRRIDLVASVSNQVRFEALDEPTVDRYVAALEAGDVFPPVIIRVVPRTKGPDQLVILSGNHRVRAHINVGRKTIHAYLVTCNDTGAKEIAYGDNANHGLPPTDEERLVHAIDLVERGRTMHDAARIVGINHQRIVKRLAQQGVEKRAANAGVAAELTKFPQSCRYRLSSLRDDRVFVKVIRSVVTHGIGTVATVKLIGDLNAQPDVASAMDLLEAHIRQHKANEGTTRGTGHPSTNPYMMLRTALGTIRGLNAADVVDKCAGQRDRDELHQLLLAGGRHLMAIDKLLQLEAQPLKVVR